MKRKAVFLDRDGTINRESGYINHPSRLELLPWAAPAIRALNKAGHLVIVVTNQAGVARGYFTEDLLKEVFQKMENDLAAEGAHIDQIYYCPHHPSVGPEEYRKDCPCRKPNSGMLEKACRDFDIDLSASYLIGDRQSDIKFGQSHDLHSIMVLTGYGRGEFAYTKDTWSNIPDHISENIQEAVQYILKKEQPS